MAKIYDINWRKVRSLETLANELLKVAVSLGEVPRNTHVINWRAVPENKLLLHDTWNDWRREFPHALHDNLMRLSPRYAKKYEKLKQCRKEANA